MIIQVEIDKTMFTLKFQTSPEIQKENWQQFWNSRQENFGEIITYTGLSLPPSYIMSKSWVWTKLDQDIYI